ncbi:chaperone [Verrucomicrobiota bacterium]|nr:chaperone [Verrucomicrobiota bacterium]
MSPPAPRFTLDAMPTESEFLADPAAPRWIRDALRFLPVKSQFILAGNIRDRYPFLLEAAQPAKPAQPATDTQPAQPAVPAQPAKYVPLALTSYATESLKLRGYQFFLEYNAVEGFGVVTPRGESADTTRKFFSDTFKLTFDPTGRAKCSLAKALETLDRIVAHKDHFIAVFLDFASRYAKRADVLDPAEHEFFSKALVQCHGAQPHITPTHSLAQFNPVFWLCDKENDLPDWLVLNNPRLRVVTIPRPDHLLRRALITQITPSLPGCFEATDQRREDLHDVFVEQTEGMVLTDVIAITQLCRREQLRFEDIGEAVRRYKLGVTEDPWKRLDRKKIASAGDFIRRRVKGQQAAITKSLDIIKRAVTGLSGSQGSRSGGRPRGVMFLAGPTGTGKTELAKTLTELLFGDERAYIRFDMSEFSAEHADQRLIGAPPGYIGSDMGGELTNAIREKPFSVVLFDEIEKAHPRILDKFLQILDDGVLTSGRGERVYFSESVIIFTSNLGIYKYDDDGHRILNVQPAEPYEQVEQKVRAEIANYFKLQLNRPEILNRMGENIVVFDFIRPDVAVQIFDKMVGGILARLADQQRITVTLTDPVRTTLRDHCLRDLGNGGRGVGNHLEAWLINPLARALFDADVTAGGRVTITSLELTDGVPTVRLQAE